MRSQRTLSSAYQGSACLTATCGHRGHCRCTVPSAAAWSRQLCPTLCDPVASLSTGILQARVLECVAMPSCRDLPDSGTEPGSPALQADSLPGKPCCRTTLSLMQAPPRTAEVVSMGLKEMVPFSPFLFLFFFISFLGSKH